MAKKATAVLNNVNRSEFVIGRVWIAGRRRPLKDGIQGLRAAFKGCAASFAASDDVLDDLVLRMTGSDADFAVDFDLMSFDPVALEHQMNVGGVRARGAVAHAMVVKNSPVESGANAVPFIARHLTVLNRAVSKD